MVSHKVHIHSFNASQLIQVFIVIHTIVIAKN